MPDLSTREAADRLGITRDTVSSYALEGRFPSAYQLGYHGPWRIPPGDLDVFRRRMRPQREDEHGVEPSSPRAAAARKAAATRNRKTA